MADEDAFEGYFQEQLDKLKEAMTGELYNALKSSIEGATRAEITALAEKQAAELVKGIGETMRAELRDMIKAGLDAQDAPREIARDIASKIGLDPARQDRLDKYMDELTSKGYTPDQIAKLMAKEETRLIRERAETIARTETRKAIEQGEIEVSKRNGATHKVWITVNDDKVSDICAGCEAEGPIPIDDDFQSSGTSTPPGHPNCRCTIAKMTILDDADLAATKQRAEDRAKKTADAKAKDTAE